MLYRIVNRGEKIQNNSFFHKIIAFFCCPYVTECYSSNINTLENIYYIPMLKQVLNLKKMH